MSCRSVTDQILHKVFHKIVSKSRSSHRSICHQRFCKISEQIFHKSFTKTSLRSCQEIFVQISAKLVCTFSKKHRHPKKPKKARFLVLGGRPTPKFRSVSLFLDVFFNEKRLWQNPCRGTQEISKNDQKRVKKRCSSPPLFEETPVKMVKNPPF